MSRYLHDRITVHMIHCSDERLRIIVRCLRFSIERRYERRAKCHAIRQHVRREEINCRPDLTWLSSLVIENFLTMFGYNSGMVWVGILTTHGMR